MLHLGELFVSEEVHVPIVYKECRQVQGAMVRANLVQVRMQGLLPSTIKFVNIHHKIYLVNHLSLLPMKYLRASPQMQPSKSLIAVKDCYLV